MIYLKSVLFGLAAAVAVVVLCVAALFAFFMLLPYLASWSSETGSGGIGFVSADTGLLFVVPLVAFVAGFYWKFRSEKRAKGRL